MRLLTLIGRRGTLIGFLGNHNNWGEDLHDYLLSPIGIVDWPYAQHDIKPLGDNRSIVFSTTEIIELPPLQVRQNPR